MYTNGNFESHMAALCFLGTAGLAFLLLVATAILLWKRRPWARYTLAALAALLIAYAGLVALFSYASYDRTARRGEEKFFCALDCHIAYSVQGVQRAKSIGDIMASGEFVLVRLRAHFDERTIAPWRGNAPLTPDPPELQLVDGAGRHYPVSASGQAAWQKANANSLSFFGMAALKNPLRPGQSNDAVFVFDVPPSADGLRLFPGWSGFPSYLLIGDEASPGHGKTYLAL